MIDPTPNLEKIAQQVRIITVKQKKAEAWAKWARDLIMKHANTIATLEQEKKALLEACKAQKAWYDHCEQCEVCGGGGYCETGIELSTKAVQLTDTAVAAVKGDTPGA
jgi:ABC-type Fe3+-hydroxamate transport system substrate-binding protein